MTDKVLFKRTKILATLGPATNAPETIEVMIEAGTNGFRLNFSHCPYDDADTYIDLIRTASKKRKKPVAILQDLQGPKIRLGTLNDNRHDVKTGDEIVLDFAAEHHDNVLPIQYNLADKVKVGESIYLFDGKVRTTAIAIESATAIRLRIENDGVLMSRKGLNLPDTDFGGDIITEKDVADIDFGAKRDIDFVALSFVQTANDIENLRQMLIERDSKAQIIAKIETKSAVDDEHLEAIVLASDGVMVARGDLAVEVGAETVPVLQRKIIALCRKHGKLSIVATQMMASMVDAPEPTRAEVGDVATAVILGADTVMLSDETAMGKYPIETIKAMKRVILYTQDRVPTASIPEIVANEGFSRHEAISGAAVKLAEQLGVRAIVAETRSGATACYIASHRPNLPIISVTSSTRVAQLLALSYANKSFVRPDGEKAGLQLAKELYDNGYFGSNKDISVVLVSGRQPGVSGGTDTIRVRALNQE